MKSVTDFVGELRNRGYSVEYGAEVRGKSGSVHSVDFLASMRGEKTVVGVARRREDETTLELIKTLTIAYDVGAEACYIMTRELDIEDRRLAEH